MSEKQELIDRWHLRILDEKIDSKAAELSELVAMRRELKEKLQL
jgi:hypothetical protein